MVKIIKMVEIIMIKIYIKKIYQEILINLVVN